MTRKTGQVSFNLRSGYEKRLYEHAYKSEHGEFSKYIKRLIERDLTQVISPVVNVQLSPLPTDDIDVSTFL